MAETYHGTLVRESSNSILVQIGEEQVWIPRSLMDRLTRTPKFGKVLLEFTLPDWKARQLDLIE